MARKIDTVIKRLVEEFDSLTRGMKPDEHLKTIEELEIWLEEAALLKQKEMMGK